MCPIQFNTWKERVKYFEPNFEIWINNKKEFYLVKKSNIQDIPSTPRTLISEHQLIEQRPPTSDEKSKKSAAKNSKTEKKSDSNPGTVNSVLF